MTNPEAFDAVASIPAVLRYGDGDVHVNLFRTRINVEQQRLPKAAAEAMSNLSIRSGTGDNCFGR
jgi:hypothetical protein